MEQISPLAQILQHPTGPILDIAKSALRSVHTPGAKATSRTPPPPDAEEPRKATAPLMGEQKTRVETRSVHCESLSHSVEQHTFLPRSFCIAKGSFA